jgi:hypothetical protein
MDGISIHRHQGDMHGRTPSAGLRTTICHYTGKSLRSEQKLHKEAGIVRPSQRFLR